MSLASLENRDILYRDTPCANGNSALFCVLPILPRQAYLEIGDKVKGALSAICDVFVAIVKERTYQTRLKSLFS